MQLLNYKNGWNSFDEIILIYRKFEEVQHVSVCI